MLSVVVSLPVNGSFVLLYVFWFKLPNKLPSSSYTFLSAKSMSETFEGNTDGCYLYSRNSSPSNLYLEEALAAMEETESANVFSSGMAAITSSILQICKSNDHIISSRTV